MSADAKEMPFRRFLWRYARREPVARLCQWTAASVIETDRKHFVVVAE